MAGIQNFTEKEIRDSIGKKVPHETRGTRKTHSINLMHNGKKFEMIQLPGEHTQKYLGHKASKKLANDLRLSKEKYNDLIICRMSGKEYLQHLDAYFSTNPTAPE